MIGLFTVDLRGRTLSVNVLREEITLLAENGDVLNWDITSEEWDQILMAASDRGFLPTKWFYARERSAHTAIDAIATHLILLNDALCKAAVQTTEACYFIQRGKSNGAIEAVANVGRILSQAEALYGTALKLHRKCTN